MAKPAPSRINPKPKTSQFSVRLADTVADRADRLLEPEMLERLTPFMQRAFVSRMAVFRECLLRGLADFESDLGLGPLDGAAPEPKPTAKPRKGRKAG